MNDAEIKLNHGKTFHSGILALIYQQKQASKYQQTNKKKERIIFF